MKFYIKLNIILIFIYFFMACLVYKKSELSFYVISGSIGSQLINLLCVICINKSQVKEGDYNNE